MNLSKMNFAFVGLMVIGVLSLNFTNPFTMSNNEFDVKGIANEISIPATSTGVAKATLTPATLPMVVAFTVKLVTKLSSCSGDATVNTSTNVFDGIVQISRSDIAMNRLD